MQTDTQVSAPDIIISREFMELLPPLDKDTYRALEENIIANGCMFPLVLWNGILVDGHNRYAICMQHNIPFKVVEKEFASWDDVIIWIISNQVARRNLTQMQLTYFRGLHYNTVKGKGGNQKGKNQYSEVGSENPTQPQALKTADLLSKRYKVHRDTIYTDAKATLAIDAIGRIFPEAKARVLSGDVQIEKKELQRLASASDDEIKAVAEALANGTYEKEQSTADLSKKTDDTGHGYTSGADKPPAEQSANPAVASAANEAYRVFSAIAVTGTDAQIKKALRELINVLQDLYERV